MRDILAYIRVHDMAYTCGELKKIDIPESPRLKAAEEAFKEIAAQIEKRIRANGYRGIQKDGDTP